jgi:arylformamidase
MRRLNLEAEYNNRERVPEHTEIQGRWIEASEAFRGECGNRAELDIAYGEHERQKYDLFSPEGDGAADAPVIVYIHGGYWLRGDRKDYSCVAKPFVEAGCRVAIPSYRLCPEVTVPDIIADAIAFTKAIAAKTGKRPLIVGHSAGGHLAGSLAATDWSAHEDVADDFVTHAYAISGLFTLRPLIRTSMNDELNLDRDVADAASPALWDAPKSRPTLVAAVGARESREFIRQSLEMVARWTEADRTAECVVIPDANHFTVLEQLMKPGSGVNARVLEMARAVPQA